MIFCFGLANFRKIDRAFLSEFVSDFFCKFFGIVSPGLQGPQTRVTPKIVSIPLQFSGPKKQPKHKVFGGIFLGHPGPRHRDIPDKNFVQVAFSVVLDREWPGYPGLWVGTSRIWKKFYARKLWADFSYPKFHF